MDPNYALKVIEDSTLPNETRVDSVKALAFWIDSGGFPPASAPFLASYCDVWAMWRGIRAVERHHATVDWRTTFA